MRTLEFVLLSVALAAQSGCAARESAPAPTPVSARTSVVCEALLGHFVGLPAQMNRTGCDSDHDGIGDVEELRRGNDPNVPGEGLLCGPRYGCGARIEPRGRPDAAAALLAAVTAIGLVLSRRFRAQ